MQRNAIETIMGGVVLVIAAAFVFFAYSNSNLGRSDSDGYHLTAEFGNVGGVAKGSDIRIGGVKIGVVDNLSLEPKTYQAIVGLTINRGINIPKDTAAAIIGDGLLGSKFVALQPGAEDEMLKDGERIEFTQSGVSIEELIGKFVFSGGGVDEGKAEKDAISTDDAAVHSKEPELSLP
ncbi:MAG: outer membrane lipid asymmetry maintenance protein MlaD [Rickettsiales bacterium]|nr:outer membrane lipid asymmetry maintenance protein MlaD [Rickettsiales bacterium]